ncbi:MAG TPA: hypothetical protein VMM37_06650 [Bacteroidota bacterium]|nr:hypothetical protein [Bacteroidota bacterium]
MATINGNVGLTSEFYSATGVSGRRPANTQRGAIATTVTLFDQISLPFEFYFTSRQTGFQQPFNQFGVSPRISDWLTLHAGYYSAQLSEYTFGDTRLLGGGVELHPGAFTFDVLFGRSQAAVEPDSAHQTIGAYKRTMWGGKVGYGKEGGFTIGLNLWHSIDDSASIRHAAAGVAPTENLVGSLNLSFPLVGNALQFSTEVAGAAFTNDTRIEEIAGAGPVPTLFKVRYSSQGDAAAKASLNIVPAQSFSVRLSTQWVGPGFVSLGYAQLPNDMFEWTVAPSARFLGDKVSVRGSIGRRSNNLRNNRLATTTRSIYSLGLNAQPAEHFGVDIQYSNYGMFSTPRNDTLRVENVSQSVTVGPRYQFQAFDVPNTLFASYSYQDVNDKNVVTSAINRNTSQMATAVWALTFPSSLNFATTILRTLSTVSVLKTGITSFTETVGYQFFENALTSSLTFGYSIIKAVSSDGQFTGSLALNYRVPRWGSIGFSLFNNSYRYGNPTAGSSFSELQGVLTYSLGF